MSSPRDQLWSLMKTVNVTYFVWLNLDDRSIKKGKDCPVLHKCTHLLRAESTCPLSMSPFASLSLFKSLEEHMVLAACLGGQKRVLSFCCKTLYFFFWLSELSLRVWVYLTEAPLLWLLEFTQGSPWWRLACSWRQYRTSSKVNSRVLI